MNETYYVIQSRVHEWDQWTTIPIKYTTPEEAVAALKEKGLAPGMVPKYYRVAQAYTQIRYKAVGASLY